MTSKTSHASECETTNVEAADDSPEVQEREISKFLRDIGLAHVPVLLAEAYAGDPNAVGRTGADCLEELYAKVSPTGVALILTDACGGAAKFAAENPTVFRDKTQTLIVVGGGRLARDSATGDTVLEPDPEATNNSIDLSSAKELFRLAQELLVPMRVISRHFARKVQIPRNFFDLLKSHGGPIGNQLYELQKASIEKVWAAACACSHDPARRGLHSRCDRSWFMRTFSTSDVSVSALDEDTWNCLSSFPVYSLIAVLMALPPVFERFAARPTVVRSIEHHVLDVTGDTESLSALRAIILQCIFTGTRINVSRFDFEPAAPLRLPDGQGWTWNDSPVALDYLLPPEHLEENLRQAESSWNLRGSIR